jgi:hypothetical protein
MEDFPLDASLGSHFFHNVTSMNVGYFSIQHNSPTEFIRWDMLQQQKVVGETEFLKHVRFEKPLSILMDGKKRVFGSDMRGCSETVAASVMKEE